MTWIDRAFVEVLRFIARHREVQLLCVCVREMWGVVLLLGLESGVMVLLLQLKGVHWGLQVNITEALALRKPSPAAQPTVSGGPSAAQAKSTATKSAASRNHR